MGVRQTHTLPTSSGDPAIAEALLGLLVNWLMRQKKAVPTESLGGLNRLLPTFAAVAKTGELDKQSAHPRSSHIHWLGRLRSSFIVDIGRDRGAGSIFLH